MKRQLYRVAYNLLRIYWFAFRPHTQGALVVLKHRGNILLVRHTYGKNLWRIPGGGVRKGEPPANTIKREIREELGIKLENPREIGTAIYSDQHKHNTVWFFEEEINSKDFKFDSVEIKEAAWFQIDKLPSPLAKSALDGLSLAKLPGIVL